MMIKGGEQDAQAHLTVLLTEAVDALVTKPEGHYVDGTFGRGGHSRLILQQLDENGRLTAIDKDPQAVASGKILMTEDKRFSICHGSFSDLDMLLGESAEDGRPPLLDGILLDLGVSSPQLDQADRGFSFMNDGPLDMRMDTTKGETASEWLFGATEQEIISVLREYGEERFARRMASAILSAQVSGPIQTTSELAKIIADANPAWEKGKHPATRAFQAIRIKVNNELDDLDRMLALAVTMLKVGGRLVVISFHSLEDRRVKLFMKKKARGEQPPPGVPIKESEIKREFKLVGKAVKPSKHEVERNVRSRSAIMRVLEKQG
jgi:16S rRNA (cytosine1402-N4)-methyltransferase